MRRLQLGLLSALLFALAAGQLQAEFISGTQTTSDGRTVNLSGLEWLKWNDSRIVGQTAVQVEASMSSGGALEGWRYASRSEFESLFDSLWGGVEEGHSESNYDGSRWLYETMYPSFSPFFTSSSSNSYYTLVNFGDPDIDGLSGNKYLAFAQLQIYNDLDSPLNRGFFRDIYGLSTGVDITTNTQRIVPDTWIDSKPEFGTHALVREETVTATPEPSSLVIFGLGVMGCSVLARFREKKTESDA